MQITKLHAALLAVLITLTGCSKNTGIGGAAGDASETTLKANALFAQELKLVTFRPQSPAFGEVGQR